MNTNSEVLVVEDEAAIRKFITVNLEREGYTVFEAETGEKALDIFNKKKPGIMVLDLMLPGIDGYEVCTKVREISSDILIIMLTAKGQDLDKIMGLDLGADDYMVKPFNPLELTARIRAHSRKTANGKRSSQQSNILTCGPIALDLAARKVSLEGVNIDITPTEYSLIKLLIENRNNAISRDKILNGVWGENFFGDIKTVDVHIRRLREKVEKDPSAPELIETVWGFGYRLKGES
ncbi:response regulator transcription factor [Proteinivorax tanatarense]|uniref:Stage 0 sporulation protein A homolog n=1 Tax=Proteinivorax tanatarense TaxID=1260629 RepID=A0AAU7VMX8_9FIRM